MSSPIWCDFGLFVLEKRVYFSTEMYFWCNFANSFLSKVPRYSRLVHAFGKSAGSDAKEIVHWRPGKYGKSEDFALRLRHFGG